tara:strand:- start:1752 stop:1991 length:240 start_codon:yes stop_codon:yes gene_type:complete
MAEPEETDVDYNKILIELYYANAMNELYSECEEWEMELALKYYEEEERYLECAGVKRALDDYKSNELFRKAIEDKDIQD